MKKITLLFSLITFYFLIFSTLLLSVAEAQINECNSGEIISSPFEDQNTIHIINNTQRIVHHDTNINGSMVLLSGSQLVISKEVNFKITGNLKVMDNSSIQVNSKATFEIENLHSSTEDHQDITPSLTLCDSASIIFEQKSTLRMNSRSLIKGCGESSLSYRQSFIDDMFNENRIHDISNPWYFHHLIIEESSLHLDSVRKPNNATVSVIDIEQSDKSQVNIGNSLEIDPKQLMLYQIIYRIPDQATNVKQPLIMQPSLMNSLKKSMKFEYISDKQKNNFKTHIDQNITIASTFVKLGKSSELSMGGDLCAIDIILENFDQDIEMLFPMNLTTTKSLGDRTIIPKAKTNYIRGWHVQIQEKESHLKIESSKLESLLIIQSSLDIVSSSIRATTRDDFEFYDDSKIIPQGIQSENSLVQAYQDSVIAASIFVHSGSLTLKDDAYLCSNNTKEVDHLELTAAYGAQVFIQSNRSSCMKNKTVELYFQERSSAPSTPQSFVAQMFIDKPDSHSGPFNLTGWLNLYTKEWYYGKLDVTYVSTHTYFENYSEFESKSDGILESIPNQVPLNSPPQQLKCGKWHVNATLSILPNREVKTMDFEFDQIKPCSSNSNDGKKTAIIIGSSVGGVLLLFGMPAIAFLSYFYCYRRRKVYRQI
eukprot:gb/GECH01010653.1/.p1 GENE.gb/GECH01010653.1/~~gb/GECH01010653.1/.p1  ORF type:complete len:652 (+),score=132.84 gb/GECH01010653.1/:1-1956(+)